jgi:hypothetical protein
VASAAVLSFDYGQVKIGTCPSTLLRQSVASFNCSNWLGHPENVKTLVVKDIEVKEYASGSLERLLVSLAYSKDYLLVVEELILQHSYIFGIESGALARIDMTKVKTCRILECNIDNFGPCRYQPTLIHQLKDANRFGLLTSLTRLDI